MSRHEYAIATALGRVRNREEDLAIKYDDLETSAQQNAVTANEGSIVSQSNMNRLDMSYTSQIGGWIQHSPGDVQERLVQYGLTGLLPSRPRHESPRPAVSSSSISPMLLDQDNSSTVTPSSYSSKVYTNKSTEAVSTSLMDRDLLAEYPEEVNNILVQPPLFRPPMYRCLFWFLSCDYLTRNREEWEEHCLAHFHSENPPRTVICPLCDWKLCSDEGDGIGAWKSKMSHLADDHFAFGERLSTSRPDFRLFSYLWQKRIIDDEDLKELKGGNHSLSRPPNSLTTKGRRTRRERGGPGRIRRLQHVPQGQVRYDSLQSSIRPLESKPQALEALTAVVASSLASYAALTEHKQTRTQAKPLPSEIEPHNSLESQPTREDPTQDDKGSPDTSNCAESCLDPSIIVKREVETSSDDNSTDSSASDTEDYFVAFDHFKLYYEIESKQFDPNNHPDEEGCDRNDHGSSQMTSVSTSLTSATNNSTSRTTSVTSFSPDSTDKVKISNASRRRVKVLRKPLPLLCWYAANGLACNGITGSSPEARRLFSDHVMTEKSDNNHRLWQPCGRCKLLFSSREEAAEHENVLRSQKSCTMPEDDEVARMNKDVDRTGVGDAKRRAVLQAFEDFKGNERKSRSVALAAPSLPKGCDEEHFRKWVLENVPLYIGESNTTRGDAKKELSKWYIAFCVLFPGENIPSNPFVESPQSRDHRLLELLRLEWKKAADTGALPQLSAQQNDVLASVFSAATAALEAELLGARSRAGGIAKPPRKKRRVEEDTCLTAIPTTTTFEPPAPESVTLMSHTLPRYPDTNAAPYINFEVGITHAAMPSYIDPESLKVPYESLESTSGSLEEEFDMLLQQSETEWLRSSFKQHDIVGPKDANQILSSNGQDSQHCGSMWAPK